MFRSGAAHGALPWPAGGSFAGTEAALTPAMTSTLFRLIELQSLDLRGSRALIVSLPPAEGRVRVAFVPVRDAWLLSGAGQRSLRQELLARCT